MPIRTSINNIQPTRKLKRTIYHTSGNALFYRGESLTLEDIDMMKKAGIGRLYELEEDESLADFRDRRVYPQYDLSQLPQNVAIDRAGYTIDGERLFPRGTEITGEMLKEFAARGIRRVKLRRTHRELRIDQYKSLKEYLASRRSRWLFQRELRGAVPGQALALPSDRVRDGMSSFTFDAILDGHTDRIPEFAQETPALREYAREVAPGTVRTKEEKQGFRDTCISCVERLEKIYGEVRSGNKKIDLEPAAAIAGDLARACSYDRDLLALLPLLHTREAAGRGGGTLPANVELMLRQIFNTAVWATIIAAGCDFNGAQVVETVASALIHDIGMMNVDAEILEKTGELTKIELEHIRRHPLLTLEILRRAKHVPVMAPFVVFQVHEREDGSGYPLRLQGGRINIMSRIVAVADVYATLNADRPDRPALPPHDSMRKLVDLGAKKQLDEELVRILAINLGLFPVGSWVILSNGSRARVLGLESDDLTRPVVAVLRGERDEPVEPEIINLAENPDVAITEAFVPEKLPDDPFIGF